MTAQRPRRRRRREAVPGPSLPRPGQTRRATGERGGFMTADELANKRPVHHVVRDFSYIHKDLVSIGIVSAAALAFIVIASFFV